MSTDRLPSAPAAPHFNFMVNLDARFRFRKFFSPTIYLILNPQSFSNICSCSNITLRRCLTPIFNYIFRFESLVQMLFTAFVLNVPFLNFISAAINLEIRCLVVMLAVVYFILRCFSLHFPGLSMVLPFPLTSIHFFDSSILLIIWPFSRFLPWNYLIDPHALIFS